MVAPPQLRALLFAINALLRKRCYHAALAMLKGFQNGAVYGAKIRAPHALVMTFLFRSGSLPGKLRATPPGPDLARFVFLYKGLCALQSHVQGKTYQAHSFVSAFIGGLLVFGNNSNVNSQISMYLLSRVLLALCRLGVEKGFIPEPRLDPFPWFTGLVWGLVLWLFEYHRTTPQPLQVTGPPGAQEGSCTPVG
ncbi:hypothetical protein M91_01147 [Bos mutus]|uniref:Peroxisomal membrane protein 4 n=1 Tax=Bos mutus TaxID=72004 RepID=L8HYJ3_9CETA|nr:PREDICTED: peroxisomal membrane protein 4 [Bos mutus]ELR49018.1 hypothetical protein M91_01147 [Bos mutus]